MSEKGFDIDFVYLWVNGNDPEWQAKRRKFTGEADTSSNENCKGRYADNDELRYSLRSLELYAPWIRKIFIVTDNQVPDWLDTGNGKVQIVDHKEILPAESLPCFNSVVLEHFMHRIPGLSEHFLYGNDDMFLNRPVTPADFFAEDGFPIVRFAERRPFRKLVNWIRENIQRRPLNYYSQTIHNAALEAEKEYGRYYTYKSHHNIDSYLRSDLSKCFRRFEKCLTPTLVNHFRKPNDIQRHLYFYASLAEKRAHKVFVDKTTSFHLYIHKPSHYEELELLKPIFFCMNDSEFAVDEDRLRSTEYLKKRFPDKSQFEK
ncbi:MAG: stealth family protein [Muribaculaceae bacterium]|nr:stealth family protein [Muribaculaceae bacterium]